MLLQLMIRSPALLSPHHRMVRQLRLLRRQFPRVRCDSKTHAQGRTLMKPNQSIERHATQAADRLHATLAICARAATLTCVIVLSGCMQIKSPTAGLASREVPLPQGERFAADQL